ncbi:MAG: hypothetical protein HP491_10405 [Nitrospira sp.]|nr:hypothetical protein [Nitrospira sp.]
MKRCPVMILLVLLLCPGVGYSTEPEPPAQATEPQLYDHYLSLKRMQESLAARSLEEQTRLQPHLQQAERKACDRLRRERQEHVPKEDYRRQGGDEFLIFVLQFEQHCQTAR